jgi:hypothetical protein
MNLSFQRAAIGSWLAGTHRRNECRNRMECPTITLTGEGIQDTQELHISISIVATINVDAKTARRRVTAWLVSEVGNMLIGGAPQLVIGKQSVWRVPVILTSSNVGTVGQVGAVDVDTESGEILVGEELREQILDNVRHLAGPTPTPVG